MAGRSKRRRIQAQDDAPERLGDVAHQAIDANAEDRAFQAYRYFVLGYTYREIADKCGYKAHTTAMRAVRKAREQVVIRDTRALAARQADRIEHAIHVVMTAIESWEPKDKLWAVDRLVPLLKRESELMALDTPVNLADTGAPQTKVIVRGTSTSTAQVVIAEVSDSGSR